MLSRSTLELLPALDLPAAAMLIDSHALESELYSSTLYMCRSMVA